MLAMLEELKELRRLVDDLLSATVTLEAPQAATSRLRWAVVAAGSDRLHCRGRRAEGTPLPLKRCWQGLPPVTPRL